MPACVAMRSTARVTASLTPGRSSAWPRSGSSNCSDFLGYIDSRTPLSNAVLSCGTLARRRTSTPVMSVLVTRGAGGASGLPGCGAVPSVNAPLIAGTGTTFSPAALTFASFPLPSRPGFGGGGTGVITVVEPSGNRRPTCALKVTGLPLTVVYTYSWSGGSTC